MDRFLPCTQSCRDKAAHIGRPCRRPRTPHRPGRPERTSPAGSPVGGTRRFHQLQQGTLRLETAWQKLMFIRKMAGVTICAAHLTPLRGLCNCSWCFWEVGGERRRGEWGEGERQGAEAGCCRAVVRWVPRSPQCLLGVFLALSAFFSSARINWAAAQQSRQTQHLQEQDSDKGSAIKEQPAAFQTQRGAISDGAVPVAFQTPQNETSDVVHAGEFSPWDKQLLWISDLGGGTPVVGFYIVCSFYMKHICYSN